jgi:hypothetical protein
MDETVIVIENTRQLIARLERISADSTWAHRSSGLRGSLLRSLEQAEGTCLVEHGSLGACMKAIDELNKLAEFGYFILENAAREIRPPERLI